LILSRNRHFIIKGLILLLFSTLSFNSGADWSGTFRSGYSYTNNLGSQQTVDQGLGTSEVVERDGWANQGNLVVQSLNMKGGQALELFGLYDYGITKLSANDTTADIANDISNLNVTASVFRALSTKWLWRLAGDYDIYRYDAVPVSGYDGYGASLTLGYFGDNRQGMDLSLAWKFEDHNQLADPSSQYDTNRVWLNLLYYLPREKDAVVWSLQGMVRQNIIDNTTNSNLRDYISFLLGVGLGNWQWGKIQGFATLQWRSNYYAQNNNTRQNNNTGQNITSTIQTRMHGQLGGGGGQGPEGGQGGGGQGGHSGGMDLALARDSSPITSDATDDQLFSAILTLSYPFSRYWSARLSVDASRYAVNSVNTASDKNLYSVFAGLQWGF